MKHTDKTWTKEYDSKINFKLDLEQGKQGEDYVVNVYTNKTIKAETKVDFRCQETGNVFIEFKSRGKDSGILITTADVWNYVLPKKQDTFPLIITIATSELKQMLKNKKYKTVLGGDNKTSIGYLVPKEDLIQLNN